MRYLTFVMTFVRVAGFLNNQDFTPAMYGIVLVPGKRCVAWRGVAWRACIAMLALHCTYEYVLNVCGRLQHNVHNDYVL